MRSLLFDPPPDRVAALRAASAGSAQAFATECRAIAAIFAAAAPEHQEFVAGEVACALHVSPATGSARLNTALAVVAQPRLLAALDLGELDVPHVLAVLNEIEHLDAPHAAQVLLAVLGDPDPLVRARVELTPGELRAATRRAIHTTDPAQAQDRHERAKKTAGVRGRPGVDGMAQVVIDCTAVQMATAMQAIRGRAEAMTFGDDLTAGQRQVAAFLHALGCERTQVQAVLECPVERAVDTHALGRAPVWTVDVRMPVAVALGLSDHPALLAGYGPIAAAEARALLPDADLVRACVDSRTGEVLAVDPPVRAKTWRPAVGDAAAALRATLVEMATSGGAVPDLTADGYVPGAALGRLVDLRDVTCTFPGSATSTRRTDRDHRLPWPLGRTDEQNLQNAVRRWHRAKHAGWRTRLLPDGTVEWTSPTTGHRYARRPKRTRPPKIPPGATLPPLPEPPDTS